MQTQGASEVLTRGAGHGYPDGARRGNSGRSENWGRRRLRFAPARDNLQLRQDTRSVGVLAARGVSMRQYLHD